MNREIKFRGKRVDNGKWCYGSLVQHSGRTEILVAYSQNRLDYDLHVVVPETVGQYVGEVCGLELWENDIVKITNLKETWRSEPQFDWRVLRIEYNRFVWSLKNYYLYMPLREMDEDCTYTYEMTLLGNIHDNPELIK